MSWQTYVDSYLVGVELPTTGGHLESAAICGLDGGIWAQSPTFPAATAEQLAEIATELQNEHPSFQAKGLFLGTRKFLVVRYDFEEKVVSAKDSPGHGTGEGGLCIKQSNTALVIGVYSEKAHAPPCNTVVEGVAKYLIDSGY